MKKHVGDPLVDVIRPHAVRFYKETRPRGDNAYQYRYPSPGSYAMENETIEQQLDHRTPFKDSVHDIKYFRHVSLQEPATESLATNGLTADLEVHLQSWLIRNADVPALAGEYPAAGR